MMEMIHEYMNLPEGFNLRECGTQDYEADVVILEQRGKTSFLTHPKKAVTPRFLLAYKLFVFWIRGKRGQQAASTVCTPPQTVQRRPACKRHPANDGRLSLTRGFLQQKVKHSHRWNRLLPGGTFPRWEYWEVSSLA